MNLSIEQLLKWCTYSLIIALLLPYLLQDGMFFDGTTYAAISKNLSLGIGSWFDPHYTNTLHPHFSEHPPLVFIIQSFFFSVLGESFLTERIYSIFIIASTIFLIQKIWAIVTKKKPFDWFPILLWISTPLTAWAYKNNLLELTMTVFSLTSTFLTLKAFQQNKLTPLIASSLFLIGAFLCKGPTGLFPLIIPFLYGLSFNDIQKGIKYNLFLVGFVLIISSMLILFFPELKHLTIRYFDQQVIASLENKRSTVSSRYQMIGKVFIDLLVPLLVVIVVALISRIFKPVWQDKKTTIFFFLVAASASFPILISMKQRMFYFVPSISLFSLAIASLALPFIKKSVQNLIKFKKGIYLLNIIITISAVTFSVVNLGNKYRDKEVLTDIYEISKHVQNRTISSPNYHNDWAVVAYLNRYAGISLAKQSMLQFYLAPRNQTTVQGYKKINSPLKKYSLWKKKNSSIDLKR